MPLSITAWSGGKTGLEIMPTGYVSMYYASVENDIPITDTSNPDSTGYYDGTAIKVHRLGMAYREITRCTVNTAEVTVNEISPVNGEFRINETDPGYVMTSYIPYSDAIYYSKPNPALYNAPIKINMCILKTKHIEEILNALNLICDYIQIPKRKYSISQYTGSPEFFTGTLDSQVPVTKQLFTEIRAHLLYLNNYVITHPEIAAGIAPSNIPTYDHDSISAAMIEKFRTEINTMEAGL